MFFLGFTAHILIYLLVPAFLVVCFYFNGTSGGSEVAKLLPAMVVYEPVAVGGCSSTTYVFSVVEQKSIAENKRQVIPEFSQSTTLPVRPSFHYISPNLDSKALRAPPVF